MGAGIRITLPHGYWKGGAHYREAAVRPLNGADEEWLAETGITLLPVERTTALLARCMTWLDGQDRLDGELPAKLTIGDREALLLHLRRFTLGERIHCVLVCPVRDCGEKMDLELKASDLLLAPYSSPRPSYELRVVEADAPVYRIRFRLPTGADQTAAARAAVSDPSAGARLLMQGCVESITDEENNPLTEWPAALQEALSSRMAELDPQAELLLNLNCTACGRAFSTLFDTSVYFVQEISGHMRQLYQQVHLLALHYHWSETEIMAMTPKKRWRYLDLLLGALGEER